MRMFLALILTVCLAPIVQAQSIEEKIKALRADVTQLVEVQTMQSQQLGGIASVQSRMQSDLMDVKQELANIQATLKAIQTASGTTVTKNSTAGWDGETSFVATMPRRVTATTTTAQSSTYQSSPQWGSIQSASGGTCANGSCGTGRTGFFGRRR